MKSRFRYRTVMKDEGEQKEVYGFLRQSILDAEREARNMSRQASVDNIVVEVEEVKQILPEEGFGNWHTDFDYAPISASRWRQGLMDMPEY